MISKDNLMMTDAYANIIQEKYIVTELDYLMRHSLVEEGILTDLKGQAMGAVGSVVDTGKEFIDKTGNTVDTITKLPDQLSKYINSALPEYVDKLSQFMIQALEIGAGGTIVTFVIGKLLMLLAKRIGKDVEENKDVMMGMLPAEVKAKVDEIEQLKESDINEYRKQVFLINKNSIKVLEKSLNQKGIKTDSAIMVKVLTFIGRSMSSVYGSIAGGVLIAYLIHKLGFNPLPIFPTLNNF